MQYSGLTGLKIRKSLQYMRKRQIWAPERWFLTLFLQFVKREKSAFSSCTNAANMSTHESPKHDGKSRLQGKREHDEKRQHKAMLYCLLRLKSNPFPKDPYACHLTFGFPQREWEIRCVSLHHLGWTILNIAECISVHLGIRRFAAAFPYNIERKPSTVGWRAFDDASLIWVEGW